ncbi:hypothetical protein H4S02_003451 [Coemansia sp. RSA 2611]|nr:hypothetical protein H4S02_003451 [Coemansia sp. RSA 2611]
MAAMTTALAVVTAAMADTVVTVEAMVVVTVEAMAAAMVVAMEVATAVVTVEATAVVTVEAMAAAMVVVTAAVTAVATVEVTEVTVEATVEAMEVTVVVTAAMAVEMVISALTPLLNKLGLSTTVDGVKQLVDKLLFSVGGLLESPGINGRGGLIDLVNNLVKGLLGQPLDLHNTIDAVTSILENQVPCLLDTVLPKP